MSVNTKNAPWKATIMALHLDPNKNMLMDLKDTHTGKHARELMVVTIVKGIYNSMAIDSYLEGR